MRSDSEVFDTVGIADDCTRGTHAAAGLTGVFFVETDDVDRAIGVILEKSPPGTEDHGVRAAVGGTEMPAGA